MESKKHYTLKNPILGNFKHFFPEITAERLRALSEKDYDVLLLETADRMFEGGRFNARSEMCLEIIDIPEVKVLMADREACKSLPDDDRMVLGFWMRLQKFCYPIFKHKKPSLTSFPWNFRYSDYSIANKELKNWLYKSPYKNLVACVLDSMFHYHVEKGKVNSVAQDDLARILDRLDYAWKHNVNNDGKEDMELHLNAMIDKFYMIYNHNEVGKRIGLSDREQLFYDAIDGIVYLEYDFRQIDMVREFSEWIDRNWKLGKKEYSENEQQEAYDHFVELMRKHDIIFSSEVYAMMTLFSYLLGDGVLPSVN